jgi:DNA-binding NtrC family response regulator
MEYSLEIIYSNDYKENKEAAIKEFEVKFITKHLKLNRGNVAATARAINFHPVSLRQKIMKLGIDLKEVKASKNIYYNGMQSGLQSA